MTFFNGTVNRVTLIIALAAIILAFGLGLSLGAEIFIIKPVKQPEDARFFTAQAWTALDKSGDGGLVIKTAYLRGLVDALQYSGLAPKASAKALDDLSGLTLSQLLDGLDKYYQDDPRRMDAPPVSVLLRIIAPLHAQDEVAGD